MPLEAASLPFKIITPTLKKEFCASFITKRNKRKVSFSKFVMTQCLMWDDPILKIIWHDFGGPPILNAKNLQGF